MELESLLSEAVHCKRSLRTVGERVTLGDLASLEVNCVETRLRRKSVPKYLLSVMSWRNKNGIFTAFGWNKTANGCTGMTCWNKTGIGRQLSTSSLMFCGSSS